MMNKKNSAMTALLALALVVSLFSTTRVHADDTMNKVDENAIVETQSNDEEFKFTVTAPETPWDGTSDLVFNTNIKDGGIGVPEIYIYDSEQTSLGGLMYLVPKLDNNSDGNKLVTFKKEDLLNAQFNGGNGPESVDWTTVDQIEFSFYYAAISGSNSQVTVYVPVKFKTPTAVSNSGVSMMLPATAPEGLEFKANVTDGADEIVVELEENLHKEVEKMALDTYKALKCKVYARVDMIVDKNGVPYILEVNTLPGMTPASLFPKSAAAKNISYSELLDKIIETSILVRSLF